MPKIIVWIDEDIPIIEAIVRPLEKAGYRVERLLSLYDARQSLELLQKADLILLDMIMQPTELDVSKAGDYPGKDFLMEIRKEHNIQTPVIVLTIVRNEELGRELRQLQDLGAISDIIHKPILPADLKKIVENALIDIHHHQ